jgi:3-dehydroquinate synthetase
MPIEPSDVLIDTDPPSRVRVRAGGLAGELEALARTTEKPIDFVVVDARVLELHGALLGPLGTRPQFVVPSGEASKSMAHLEALLEALADAGLDRHGRLLSFGGGVTSDLAGLAAALYMRGINWTSAPTTLLAQVDASVGGKTAINLPQAKNLVGAFHQPSDVLVDTTLLATLEPSEWRSGLGEVLKAALLGARLTGGDLLFDFLESLDPGQLAAPGPEQPGAADRAGRWAKLVLACVAHKAAVVAKDFEESGVREQLNLGHTFAHAIEHVAGFGTIPHGVAVAAGLGLALELSHTEGLLEDPTLRERTEALATKLGLPTGLRALEAELGSKLDRAALETAMTLDKKASNGAVRFVLPRAIGSWESRCASARLTAR